ncbi:polymorphic toxin type 8 domain-containing protein [Chryseobacterium sp. CBSDS_008]|uniref:polymorphic toxin type 8 domain-containing protein n=1 Tax=Chryseobacterium sp. CBSDS_008 TaxID=3415265 RepID=UPI003CEBEDFE
MQKLNLDKDIIITDAKDPPDEVRNKQLTSPENKSIQTAQKDLSEERNAFVDNHVLKSEDDFSGLQNIFEAKEKQGTIGTFSEKEDDKISDNFFTVQLPANYSTNGKAYLEYDLYGLASYESVPRSINRNIAFGGDVVVPNANWLHQREEINMELLKVGTNTILFSRPLDGVKYKVKNLKIAFEKNKSKDSKILVSSVLSGDKLYVKGNELHSDVVYINNDSAVVQNGEFEKVISITKEEQESGQFTISSGGIVSRFKTPTSIGSFKVIEKSNVAPKKIEISTNTEVNLNYEDLSVNIAKESSDAASIEILKLREKDFPATSQGLKNVTLNNAAYRLSVTSGKLVKKVKISIPYDEKRLGLISPNEVKVFYFDYAKKEWKIEPTTVVDEKSKSVTFETDKNHDYINGIIAAPESPVLNSFAPTTISGLKSGDPASGVQLLAAPSANQRGDASMTYPVLIPTGVNGMQPQLAITYSSSKGNGWMGEGWDISGISGITLDTRWGTPTFESGYESEIYLLDGEMLIYEGDYLPHRHVNLQGSMDVTRQPRNSSGKKNFYLRKNNGFTKIERYGSSPSSYTWVVTTTDGTKKYYGGTENGVNTNAVVKANSGGIVQWGITKEIDIHNNNIKYKYLNKQFVQGMIPISGDNINLENGRQFHIETIKYGGINDDDGPYTILFSCKDPSRPDYSISTKEGLKRVEIERLDLIDIRHGQNPVRNYTFTYTTGSFYKSLLKTISGPGVNYQLDYYNDTGNAVFAADKFVNAPAPEAFSGAVNSALTPSRISADNNFEWGWALRTGAGLGLFIPHRTGDKNFMVSGFLGESYPDIKRGQELIDFNGDGIADILYRKRNGDNGIKLIPGSLDGNGNLEFSAPQLDVLNLKSNFTKTTGSTFNAGATVLINWWKMGFDFTKSWSESESKTPVYVIDANSDGLPDVVKDDKVWFNKINPNGQPEMVTTSDMTENMVMKGSVPVPYTEPENLDNDEGEEPVKAKNDVVKVWIAPKAGFVTIYDHISITDIQETKARAVYSIEVRNPNNLPKNGRVFLTTLVGGNPNIDLKITKYDEYPGTPLGINNSSRIHVESGDKIYFRLHKKTGLNYEVNTRPSVQYVNGNGSEIADSPEEEIDDFMPNNLQYEKSYILNNLSKTLKYDFFGTKHLSVPGFSVPKLNDNVTFKITLSKPEVVNPWDVTVIYEKTYPQSLGTVNIAPVDMNFTVPPPIPGGYHLKFSVISDSYMNKEIEWKNINVNTDGYLNVLDVADYPSYYVRDFKKKFHVADLGNNAPHGTNDYYIAINKNFGFSPSLEGAFMYVIKKGGLVVEKRWVKVSNSGITETSVNGYTNPIKFYTGDPYQSPQLDDRINIVVYCNSQNDRAAYESLKAQLQNQIFNIYAGTATTLWSSTVETALFTAEFNSISAVYRNWGQFIYNESKDVKKTANSLTPPGGPRDIPNGPSGNTTPDYTINPDTPKDSYGALINNDFLDSPFGQFNYNFSACSGITNQNDYAECVGNIVQADYLNMANTNVLAAFNPIIPMSTYYAKGNQGIDEKWINNGFTEQFSKASSFRDEESMTPFFVDDDPDEQDVEVQGNVNTAMYAIEKKQKSKAKTTNWGIGIPVVSTSTSELRGYGNINTQDFFDVNGDGYPDMLYRTESQLTNSLGGLRGGQGRNLENNPDSVISTADSFQKTNTIAFNISAVKTVGRNTSNSNSTSKPDSSPAWSGGTSFSSYPDSYDKTQKYWLDVNGDGLVDRVVYQDGQVRYKLNYGTGLVSNAFESFANLELPVSKPVGSTSVSIGGGLSGMISQTSTFSSGWGISGNLTGSSSTGTSKKTFLDVNGDGMVDLISIDEYGNTSVNYNTGNKFAPAQGLSKVGGVINFADDSKTYNGALTLNGGFYINVPLVWLFGVTILYFRAGADMSGNIGVSMAEINKGLRDVNGDGFPDLVINNGNGLQVNYSKIGRTNKLSKVTEKTTNGTFTIDYEFTKPTYNEPHSMLVMKEVKILNPNVDSDTYTLATDDKNIVSRFKYENAKYDRRERAGYGFEKVTTEDMNGTNVYRKTVQTYYNSNYYNNGTLLKTEIYGGTILKNSTVNSFKLYKYINNYTQVEEIPLTQFESYDTGGTQGNKSALILSTGSTNTTYENGGAITTSSVLTYNNKAQLTAYKYNSNVAAGTYYSAILYHNIAALNAKNILDIPSEIKVFDNANNLMRQRNSEVDQNTGDLTKVIVKLNGSQTGNTILTYDTFGNIKTTTNPVGYKVTYEYDPMGKYVTKITDNFGVSSSAIYDPVWDAILESTDATGNKIKYTYDALGRLTSILAPKEVGISPYTVKYTYFTTPYSSSSNLINLFGVTTQNYDPDNPSNPIETIALADFSGKTIQVKKDIFIAGAEKMSVAGLTINDIYGRPVKQYHPTFEAKDPVLNKKLKLTMSPYFSATQFDQLDRPIVEIDEDGNVTDTKYEIEGTSTKVTVTKLQNISNVELKSETLNNAEGKIVQTRNFLGTTALKTQRSYDAVGQLLSVTDPENIIVKYEYDLGGRKTLETHTDRGVTRFSYSVAGQLLSRFTANLVSAGAGTGINYKYTFNRLMQVTYPNLPNGNTNPSNVNYTYGTAGNQTGRVTLKTDGTGETSYTYGSLGEVTSEYRKVIGYNIPTMTFTTAFDYDSWNRIKSITYPDGEFIRYKYDLGGNLKSIKSTQNGDYVKDIQYDEYEQRTKIINGNDTYSVYTYAPKTRNLNTHLLKKDNYTTFLSNDYRYDYVGNIISNTNSGDITPNQLGGSYQLIYGYDSLNRLTRAVGAMLKDIKGDPVDPNNMNASYETTLTYTKSGGLNSKVQSQSVSGVVNTANSYNHIYKYIKGTHQVSLVSDQATTTNEGFKYDSNGNPVVVTSPTESTEMFWDEEDNMKAYFSRDAGVYQYYTYDNKGERTIKYNLTDGTALYQNGALVNGTMVLNNYKVYPNSYVVVSSDNTFTKHYFAGAQRIASRLADNPGIFNKSVTSRTIKESTDTTSIDAENDFKSYLTKAGIKGESVETEFGKNAAQSGLYYLHGDQLGTATFVTDDNAVATQFFLNLPFGETFVEQQVVGKYENPYKFNAKELDFETGLYYYGKRYYNPRFSIWYGVDPLYAEYPSWSPYVYTLQNPIKYIDPDGRLAWPPEKGVEGQKWQDGDGDFVYQHGGWKKDNGAFVGFFVGNQYDSVNTINTGGTPGYDGKQMLPDSNYDYSHDLMPGKQADDMNYWSNGESGTMLSRFVETTVRDATAVENRTTTIDAVTIVLSTPGKGGGGMGRSGKQARLRELSTDPKLGRADKGWLKQEINQINRGKRTNIRNPPGKDLAHERGREAAKGYSYKYSHLQNRKDHRNQHKYDNGGRKNKERPVK